MSGVDVDSVDGVVRIRVRVGEKTAALRVTKDYARRLALELVKASSSSRGEAERIMQVLEGIVAGITGRR